MAHTITLERPDTAAMRAILRLMTCHAVEDNAVALRMEADEAAEYADDDDAKVASLRAEADANELCEEIVNTALMPLGI